MEKILLNRGLSFLALKAPLEGAVPNLSHLPDKELAIAFLTFFSIERRIRLGMSHRAVTYLNPELLEKFRS